MRHERGSMNVVLPPLAGGRPWEVAPWAGHNRPGADGLALNDARPPPQHHPPATATINTSQNAYVAAATTTSAPSCCLTHPITPVGAEASAAAAS